MFTTTDPLMIPVLAVCGIAVVTDLWRGKIYNWLTLSAFAYGLVYAFIQNQWQGLVTALLAAGLGFLLYGFLYMRGAMGAGDVKLLMALGAMGGIRYVADTALFAVFIGGAIALVTLIAKGTFKDFAKRMYRFFYTLFVKELSVEAPKIDRKQVMPFGVAIAAAAVWLRFDNPLVKWGLAPWHG